MTVTRKAWIWLLLALAIALAAAGVGWRMLQPPEVDALRVEAAPLVRVLQFTARVASDTRVEVGATVTARVARVLVDEGDDVAAGQLLVALEAEEAHAALQQAQASERQAQARLAGLRSTGRQAASASVAQAEAQWRNARADFERADQLRARGFVSAARVDEARRILDVATAQREAARAQALAAGEAGADVAQAQAQLASAHAASEAARARLAQAQVRAPAAARVLLRQAEPGQIIQPGRALLTLALQGPRELVAPVDERFLEQLAVGQPATAVADAYPRQPFTARVSRLAPTVDPRRGTVEVRLALPQQPPGFLREDLTVSVEVETGRSDRAPAIALAALRGPDSVWVEEGGRVAARQVRLGLRTIDAAEVLEGLAPGDRVLVGADVPPPGSRVRTRPLEWQPGRPLRGRPAEDPAAAFRNAMDR